MKIVINKCFGGFSISKEAAEVMAKNGCKRAKKELQESKDGVFYGYGLVKGMRGEYDRTSPYLINAVETLGKKSWGHCAKLKVFEIPDGIEYYIDNYDGLETIHETHRSW